MFHKSRKDPAHKRLLNPNETAINLVAVYNTNNSEEDHNDAILSVEESAEIAARNRHPLQFNALYQFPPLQRILLAGIRYYSGSETSSTWTRTPAFAITRGSRRSDTAVRFINRAYAGWNFFSEIICPAVFTGATIYGAANFRLHPNSHYNDTAGWRLLGVSNNFSPDHGAALLANMSNGDIPAWASFWPPVIAAGVAGGTTLGYAIYRSIRPDRLVFKYNYTANDAGEVTVVRTFSLSIRYCLHELEYNGQLSDAQKKHYLSFLKSKAQYGKHANRLHALMALAQLAQHPEQTQQHVKEAREFIWQQQLVCPIANLVSYFYNLHQNPITQRAFNALRVVFHFYSKAQLWRLFIYKLMQWRQFEQDREHCESAFGLWLYAELFGEYDCGITNADYVNALNNHAGQSVLTQLLRYPRTPSRLITEITQIAKHGPLTEFDFSQQAWADWCLADLDEVFSTIEQHVKLHNIKKIIFATKGNQVTAITPEQATILSSFVAGTHATQITIDGLGISDENIVAFAQALPENMTQLTLRHVVNASSLLEALKPDQLASLQQLSVTGCELSTPTVQRFLPQALNLTELDLSHTQLTAEGVDFIHEQCANSTWQSLKLRGNDLSVSDAEVAAGCLMTNPHLTIVDYSKTQLDDFTVTILAPALGNSSVLEINLDENYFSSEVAGTVLSCVQGYVAIGGNDMIGNELCAHLLPKINLTGLSIANTTIGGEGLRCIIEASQRIQALNVSVTEIRARDLNQAFANMIMRNQSLATLDLSMLNITAAEFSVLTSQLSALNVTALSLAGNPLQDALMHLAPLIHPQGLTQLDISETGASDQAVNALVQRLPGSALRVFIANGNPNVTSRVLTTLARTLIPGVPAADLGHANIDRQRMISDQSPASNLTTMSFAGMRSVSPQDAEALCQVLPATGLQQQNSLQLGNQTLSTDIAGCPSNFGDYPIAIPESPCSVPESSVTATQRARFFSPVASVPSLSSQLASTAGSAFMGTLAVEQLKSLQEQYFPNNRAAEMLLSILHFAPMALLPAPELLFALGGLALAIVLKRQTTSEKNHSQLNDALIQTIALCVSHLPNFLQAPAMPLLLLIAANVVGSQAARSISGREQNHAPHSASPQP